MITFAKPANSGVANISSMIVPCIVNSWLYCSGVPTSASPGSNSWARMTSAMTPPRQKNRNEVIRYRYPMVLWSVVVIHLTTMLPFRTGLGGATRLPFSIGEAEIVAVIYPYPSLRRKRQSRGPFRVISQTLRHAMADDTPGRISSQRRKRALWRRTAFNAGRAHSAVFDASDGPVPIRWLRSTPRGWRHVPFSWHHRLHRPKSFAVIRPVNLPGFRAALSGGRMRFMPKTFAAEVPLRTDTYKGKAVPLVVS